MRHTLAAALVATVSIA
jgi:hypothetical protein